MVTKSIKLLGINLIEMKDLYIENSKALWKKLRVKLLSCVYLLRPHGLWPTRLLHPWDSPGKSTGVGCHFLLQGIFLTQGSKLGLLHCGQMLYPLSHQGSPNKQSLNKWMDPTISTILLAQKQSKYNQSNKWTSNSILGYISEEKQKHKLEKTHVPQGSQHH